MSAIHLSHPSGHPAPPSGCVGWVIRPGRPADRLALSAFYAGLGRHTLRCRFHVAFSRLSPSRIAQLTALSEQDPRQVFTLVATEEGPNPGVVVAHAGWHVDAEDGAEFALVVADEHQGAGIGRRLVQALVAAAARRGLRTLHASVMRDNEAMRGLLASLGYAMLDDPEDPGLLRVEIPVPRISVDLRVPVTAWSRQLGAWCRMAFHREGARA